MRTPILTTVAILVFAVSAQAGGINLAWDDCGAFGTSSKTFACNTNNGVETLILSFAPSADLPNVGGWQGVIDISSSTGALPPWWSVAILGGCRQSLSFMLDFTMGPFNCVDLMGTNGDHAIQYTYQFQGNTNHARLLWIVTDGVDNLAVTSGVEYYAFGFHLNHQRTVGTNACDGCLDPVCVVAQDVELLRSDSHLPNVVIANPLLSQSVTWQSGVANCPGATPARASTWGSVKALYR